MIKNNSVKIEILSSVKNVPNLSQQHMFRYSHWNPVAMSLPNLIKIVLKLSMVATEFKENQGQPTFLT